MEQEKNSILLETKNSSSEEFFRREVGISEAVQLTGRNKGKISIDSTSGVLKFTVNEKGNRRYKVSDLYQLYGFKNPDKTVYEDVKKQLDYKSETLLEMALLKQKVEYQTEQLRRSEDEIRYLREKQDSLIDQNNRLTLLLPSLTKTTPEPSGKEAQPAKLSFWKRLFL
jgi:hypothetical protein